MAKEKNKAMKIEWEELPNIQLEEKEIEEKLDLVSKTIKTVLDRKIKSLVLQIEDINTNLGYLKQYEKNLEEIIETKLHLTIDKKFNQSKEIIDNQIEYKIDEILLRNDSIQKALSDIDIKIKKNERILEEISSLNVEKIYSSILSIKEQQKQLKKNILPIIFGSFLFFGLLSIGSIFYMKSKLEHYQIQTTKQPLTKTYGDTKH